MKKALICFMFCLSVIMLASCNFPSNNATQPDDKTNSKPTNTTTKPELDNVVDLVLDEERTYTGTINKDGLPEGEGILTWVLTNCVYEGEFKNGLYDGEGTFYWYNIGDKLVGTFKQGVPTYGTYTYANTMSYTGEFNSNWQYHGQGKFDWSTYNAAGYVVNYGWLYEGEFKNGSPAGCDGKVTFTDARMNDLAEGVHWFKGNMNAFPGLTPNQAGQGKIKYGDGTYYIGDVYYTGSDFLRVGNGTQYYDLMQIDATTYGGPNGELMYKIDGQFNHHITGWMYGNCVVYMTDSTGNPTSYMTGFWNGAIKTGEWDNTLSELVIDERWANTKEVEFNRFNGRVEHYQNMYADKTSTNVLYIGDSYFEMWRKEYNLSNYEEQMQDYDTINTAIGGTTAADWLGWLEESVNPYNAQKIVVHLGINDVNLGLNDVANRLIKLLDAIHTANPNAKIYYCSIEPSILFQTNWSKAEASNRVLEEYCDSKDYLAYIDTASVFLNNDTSLKSNYYCVDNLHPSTEGYDAMTDYINKQIGLIQ